MTPENFCYWLQGFFEISGSNEITSGQAMMIKRHLDLVFHKSPITHPQTIEYYHPPQEGTGSPTFPFDQIKVTCDTESEPMRFC